MASPSTPLLSKKTQSTLPALTIEAGKRHFPGGDDDNLEDGMRAEVKEQRKLRLFRAAISGQWKFAAQIYEYEPEVFNAKISKRGHTALHIAAAAGHTQFVNQLIDQKMVSRETLSIKNDLGNTAFCHAAISGNVKIAKKMLEADESLVTILGTEKALPLQMAAALGHKEMVDYLYKKTADRMNDQDRKDLLITLIDNDIYDVAIQMVKAHPELAAAVDNYGKTAFNALARKNFDHQTLGIAGKNGTNLCYFSDLVHQGYLELLQLFREDQLQGIKNISSGRDSKPSQADGKDSKISKVIKSYNYPIFTAAARGNVEFLTTIIGSHPDLLFELDENNYSIFHIAVVHRQENVFALINTIGTIKHFLAVHKDEKENNMLHLAGELSPQSRLDDIPGAAFQLQHELLWFKEVEKVVQPQFIEAENKEGQTPEELFREKHKDLIDDGKTWMKETAGQCMLVATFIAGVAFGAALSVPGGTKGGVPVLLKQTSFQVFTVADGLSLMFTISAVLNFFSIITSRSTVHDYLKRLPNKLVLGLATLFISIVALMVAFVAAFFIVFRQGNLGCFLPIVAIAPFPVLIFFFQQYKLIVGVIRSTYFSKLLFRPYKHSLLSAWKSNEKSRYQSLN